MAITLKNVRPIAFDAPQAATDVHIGADGTVSASAEPGARVIDCGGAWLSPGWTDLHVHIWHGGTDISIRAEDAGMKRGVTAMADAGSAGEASFQGLRQYVIDRRPETIKAFLNIGSIGLVACNRVPELIDDRFIDVDRTLAVIEANRDVICGVKVRASGVIVGAWGITPALIAKRVAEIAGLPLMVHIGEPPPLLDQIFDILTPGDIVTHCFNGKKAGSIADTPKLMETARRLAGQGVLMDVGHGAASYNFRVAGRAIGEGLTPFSISTDLHGHNIDGPVYDLATTASKVLAAGLGFEDCVAAISNHPRHVLGLSGADGLTPGMPADFTVFDLLDSAVDAVDSDGGMLRIERMFEPRWSILGTTVEAASRADQGPGDAA